MTESPLAVSAPGKVLFTGGFLVLDRKHTGLVLGLDARIHVQIEDWGDHDVKSAADASTNVLVQSPQFQDAKWLYSVSTSSSASVSVEQVTE